MSACVVIRVGVRVCMYLRARVCARGGGVIAHNEIDLRFLL